MRKENTQKLITDFPELFREYVSDKNYIDYGIAIGDGWFDLLYQHCVAIEKETEKQKLFKGSEHYPKFAMIKEKFGLLRAPIMYANKQIHALSDLAEIASSKTCERCGQQGVRRHETGYIHVSCDACEQIIEKDTYL